MGACRYEGGGKGGKRGGEGKGKEGGKGSIFRPLFGYSHGNWMKNEQHMLDLAVWVLAGMVKGGGREGRGEGKGRGERVRDNSGLFLVILMVTG